MSEQDKNHPSDEEIGTVLNPVHASTVHLGVNNSDFVIVFGEIKPLFGGNGLIPGSRLEHVASVSMSPITAKQLYRALQRAIENFEKGSGLAIPEFGSIQEIEGSDFAS